MARNSPTDLQILQTIYDLYYDEFCAYDQDETIRGSKIFVPVDCYRVASKLKTNGDIVFGRLYYHLANKYKYTDHDNGTAPVVRLFEFQMEEDPKCVHFPFMASVLADLKVQDRRFKLTLTASIAALCISIASLFLTGFEKFSSDTAKEKVELKYYKPINPPTFASTD
ncbi:hypothetical protein [Gallaecimonas pentaromativorans]|uniref:Uncharacterized protein n=1 Tax=Gallaecimonas pentaromativorans TaxID=584787 RepID=A0A3N1P5H2_9GAMM|nr:hypothetical protein [Gallaecimonas pentaromativorans]ROQ23349.1 hypothetical protein EDC28_10887 [Gallaecimonas pentaromativorans]